MTVAVKLIPLSDWAASMRGGKVPARNTLKAWIAKGCIQPRPVKVGAGYYCEPNARYVDPEEKLLERINGR